MQMHSACGKERPWTWGWTIAAVSCSTLCCYCYHHLVLRCLSMCACSDISSWPQWRCYWLHRVRSFL